MVERLHMRGQGKMCIPQPMNQQILSESECQYSWWWRFREEQENKFSPMELPFLLKNWAVYI